VKRIKTAAGMFCAAALFATSAHASAVYQYIGNPLTSCVPLCNASENMTVQGTITLSAPLAPNTSYPNFPQLVVTGLDFTADLTPIGGPDYHITLGDAKPFAFNAGTDQSGNIVMWDLDILNQSNDEILTANVPGSLVADSGQDHNFFPFADNSDNPGTWKLLSSSSSVPEPGSYALGLSGLGLLALMVRQVRSCAPGRFDRQ
jgi:hypothetical protein